MKAENYQHISDNALLERFYTDRDNRWLGILLQRYTMLLFGVCMKYLKNEEDAKDSVQQVFLKSIAELHKYKVEYFKSWVYMVAKNHCLMKLRERNAHAPVALSEQSLVMETDPAGLQQHAEKEKMLNAMSDAIEQLPAPQKQCVNLFYLQKKSYQEITGITGFTLMQVKSHIQNGKRNLKIGVERLIKEQ